MWSKYGENMEQMCRKYGVKIQQIWSKNTAGKEQMNEQFYQHFNSQIPLEIQDEQEYLKLCHHN